MQTVDTGTPAGLPMRLRGQRAASIDRSHGDEIRQLRYEMAAIGVILARHAEVLDRILCRTERVLPAANVHEGAARSPAPPVRPFTPRARAAERPGRRTTPGLGRGLDALLGGAQEHGQGGG
ncbi:MAG: hypothetical protein AB7T37_00685 [Dehalococcoidia bacterium]